MATTSDNKKLPQPALCLNRKQIEMAVWGSLLLASNYLLVKGKVASHLIFIPQLVINGEWHRVFFSPFTHVSWYHFALDATAFLLLWNGLKEVSWRGRYLYFTCCWLGSLTLPLLFSANVYIIGLCGLSGIAHGLFAITSLEMIRFQEDKTTRYIGFVMLLGVVIKVGLEMISNGTLMTNMHFGNIGEPIYSSHLGGIIGGVFAFSLIHFRDASEGKGKHREL